MSAPAGEVTWSEERGRYELRRGDELVAFCDVTRAGATRAVLPHTVTLPAHRGQGHATQLVAAALADLRAQGVTDIVPACWFVAEHLRAEGAA